MTKSKAQGTAFETALVEHFKLEGFRPVGRIAEGGMKDIGDVLLHDNSGTAWVIEAKATERLNVTRVLAKAIVKGGPRTVLIWRRLVKTGKKVRQPDGEKVVVILTLDLFTELLNERDAG